MPDLDWYLPLERCTTLDEIGPQWRLLLERHAMTPAHPAPAYQDAVLSFVGRSALSPHLKLAAVLAFGSAFDVDLRLALGALAEQTWEAGVAWPDKVAAAVSDNGPALEVASADERLAAFVLGRLAGLRETIPHDGTRLEHWQSAFWDRFLEMACRHAAADAVALALRHGADPCAHGAAAIAAAAGPHPDDDACRSGAHCEPRYEQILLQLLDAGPPRATVLAAALPAAAAADHAAMLDFLLAQGADLDGGGTAALAAAARQQAFAALEWLLAHGAGLGRDGGAALLAAAAASLGETMVEAVLAAGADPVAGAAPALRAAFETTPWDLYSAENDFVELRAAIVALLLRRGARSSDAGLVEALRRAYRGRELATALLEREDLGPDGRAFVARLAARAFGDAAGAEPAR